MKNFRIDEAMVDFDKAIELDPKNADAYAERGNTKFLYDRGDEGRSDIDKAIEINPKHAKAYCYRAALRRYEDKDNAKAMADVNKSIELDPKYGDAYADAVTSTKP